MKTNTIILIIWSLFFAGWSAFWLIHGTKYVALHVIFLAFQSFIAGHTIGKHVS